MKAKQRHVRFTPRKRTFGASSLMSALCQMRTLIQQKARATTRASKNAEVWSRSGLAVCLGNARLEWLYGRERDLLSQRCKFLGLLGQCLELLA